MTSRHQRIKELFYRASLLPTAERSAFLDAECADDDALRAEIDDLLAFHIDDQDDGSPASFAHTLAARPRDSAPAAKPSSPSLNEDQVIAGRYRIIEPIGEGGMGEVFRAYDLVLDVTVALKILHRASEHYRQRLLEEVRLARRVTHPAVCRVFDVGVHDETVFLTMEYIEGEDLDVHLARHGRLPPTRVIDIGLQLCSGLAAAHQAGVLHRDLKPANILLDGRGQVRITDFGIARSRSSIAREDVLMGTPAYMAPEQIDGRGATNERTDLYALGLVMHELLTGMPTFQAKNHEEMFECQRRQLPTPPSQLVADVPPMLEQSILSALQKRPLERPASARAMADMLSSAAVTLTLPPAERRLLTVLWCDLTGTTRSWRQLDIEEQREQLHLRKGRATGIVQRHGGRVAQHLARGLVAHFGYPEAHDQDAERAVIAGLEILAGVEQVDGLPQAAVSIHAGPVIIEEVEHDGQRETVTFGDTVSVARLQAIAEHGKVIVSGETMPLLRNKYRHELRGHFQADGIDAPVAAFHILAIDRADAPEQQNAPLTPFIGRDDELRMLIEAVGRARARSGHAVLLSGEAGIGKSRLLQELRHNVARHDIEWLEGRSSPHTRNTPFASLVDLIRRVFSLDEQNDREWQSMEVARQLAGLGLNRPELEARLCALLSLPYSGESDTRLAELTPNQRRTQLIEGFVAFVRAIAESRPVVLLCEDAHWSDPSSLEAIERLLSEYQNLAILVILSYRPDVDKQRTADIESMVRLYSAVADPTIDIDTTQPLFMPSPDGKFMPVPEERVTAIHLVRLDKVMTRKLLASVAVGRSLSDDILDRLSSRSDGVPLFAEELFKAMVEVDADSAVENAVPLSLQSSLSARLDRLGPAKPVVQVAAALGREFTYRLIVAVAEQPVSHVHEALERLVEAELIYQRGAPPDASYVFKHALINEAAYHSMLRKRRRDIHTRIIEHLPEVEPHTLVASPEVFARHLEAAGRVEEAIKCWRQAGAQATYRFANREAIEFLESALSLLRSRPTSEDDKRIELAMQLDLGNLRREIRGELAPGRQHAYARALELCRELEDTAQESLYASLGLWTVLFHKGRLEDARAIAEHTVVYARGRADDKLLVFGLYAMTATTFWLGDMAECRAHVDQLRATYERDQHASLVFEMGGHPQLLVDMYDSLTAWMDGRDDGACKPIEDAIAAAEDATYPWTQSWLLLGDAWLRVFRRDPHGARVVAEKLATLAVKRQFFMWLPVSRIIAGWAEAMDGDPQTGATAIERGLNELAKADQLRIWRPFFYSMEAHALVACRRPRAAAERLRQAVKVAERTGERFWLAELHRQQGQALAHRGEWESAESAYRRALEVAQQQSAFAHRVRAGHDLAKMWIQRGRRQDAIDLLTGIVEQCGAARNNPDIAAVRALVRKTAS